MKNDPNLAPQEQPNDAPVNQLDQTSTPSSDPLLDDTTGTNSLPVDETPRDEAVIPPAPMTKPKSKKKLAIIISSIVIGFLLLLGGGAALAYNLWYQNPDKVIGDALMNLVTSESATLKGSLSGESDGTALDLTIDARANGTGVQGTVNGTINTEDVSVDVAGEVISLSGADLYFKLDDTQQTFTQLLSASGTPFDTSGLTDFFSGLDGQWIRVSADELGNVDEEAAKVQECLGTLETKLRDNRALLDEVGQIYRSNMFIVVDEELGSRDVEGVASLGYRISVDVEAYNTFVGAFEATALYDEIKACNENFDLENVRLEADDVQDTTIEVWISQWSHELTELSLTGTNESAQSTLKVNTTFVATDEVVAPADSKTIQEVYEEFITAFSASLEEA